MFVYYLYFMIAAVSILFAGVMISIARSSDKLYVERTAQINAPPNVVFDIINDLHQWPQWSPYDRHDPNMTKSFEGASVGPGSIYIWNGNNHVGEGRLTIVESKPHELVVMRLEFTHPFACNNRVDFKLVPTSEGTQVSWIMEGKHTFVSKLIALAMDMDKVCGSDFEVGLDNLRRVAQVKT